MTDPIEVAARAFLLAWERAESNRGCYSCSEEHDMRCMSLWHNPHPCNCGRVELNAAADALREALGMGER